MSESWAENDFEESLVRAATDPAARPEFFRRLLDANLCFVTVPVHETPVEGVLEAGSRLPLVVWKDDGGDYVPFFSSRTRVEEVARRHRTPMGLVEMRGRDAFQLLARGPKKAFLNPGFPYGKRFSLDEIRKLGRGDASISERIVVEKPTRVRMDPPTVYPHALVEALRTLFARLPSVDAAYLAQIHDPGSDVPAHPMVGIVSSDYPNVVEQAGAVAQAVGAGLTDFVEVTRGSEAGAEGYLVQQTMPFYERLRGA